MNRERLLDLYRQSDVSIAHVGSSPAIDATMIPNKLFEYMAAGNPIIYASRGAAAELLREIGCAVTATPENAAAMSTAIAELLRDPERMLVRGGKGRSRVWSDSHRDKLMERLVSAPKERFADGPDAWQRQGPLSPRTPHDLQAEQSTSSTICDGDHRSRVPIVEARGDNP